MLITKLGEFGLIERFRKAIKTGSSVIKGSGDDCAVLAFDKNRYQLFTCDMLVEGVDFTKKDNPYLIGRKALAVSISDIAACAGVPLHFLVSASLPKGTTISFADKLFKGILDLAGQFKINLVGGDLSRSGRIVIDVSLLGLVEKRYLALRSAAKTGDFIFVTGALGGSIYGKHLKFIPRVKEARFLAQNYKVNAMIDISDGLSADLSHILKESQKGAVLYESMIPLSKQARGLSDALYSGEDFELLFTLSASEAKRLLKRNTFNFKLIGEIVDKKYGLKLIGKRGKQIAIKPKGFRHF